MNKRKRGISSLLIQTVLILGIVILLNVLSKYFYTYFDLTEDKRFTLASSTEKLLDDVDEVILIDVLLGGELPSDFKRLQSRTEELLREFNNNNSNIEFNFINPSEGTIEEINTVRQNLAKDGINPVNLFIQEEDQKVEKLIYPYAIFKFANRKLPVNLLEPKKPEESEQAAINRSATMLEYKLTNALSKLFADDIPIVLFTTSNGEYQAQNTAMLEQSIGATMNTGRINLDSIYQIDKAVDVLIVAKPVNPISLKKQFIIDQYIMNGGKVIWLIDQFFVNLDSLNTNTVYIPKPIEHGLDDLFFKYGVRIKKDLILDLDNNKIPQVIGDQGGKEQTQLFDWMYHPMLHSNSQNPIVKNIDRVYSKFPSSIEILPTREQTERSVLLTSSEYSRYQKYPMRLSFEVLRIEQKEEAYNKPNLPVAVLLEGEFESFFKNRVSEEMHQGLKSLNAEFVEKSPSTAQIFISDAEIISNYYEPRSGKISPMGYNQWTGKSYGGNKDFMVNAIDYLLDDYGLIEARSKNIKLRLLDQVELKNNKLKWQLLNLILPTLLVFGFGLIFNFLRKRKYTKS